MLGHDYFSAVASRPPLSRLHPRMGQFFKDYLAGEKAIRFNGQLVLNAHFPPSPSRAFEQMADHFLAAPDPAGLYSLTWAVTNRCDFNCWHCYNAGRSQIDLPLARMQSVARKLQDLGAVMVTLTGGEPLLRGDLESIASAFDDRSCLIVGTTGWGLSSSRARALKQAGIWGIGISLDSDREEEHDALRRRPGAFAAAIDALAAARAADLYAYVVSVATPDFLREDRFMEFLSFAQDAGALEVHLLEPCPAGRLAGRTDVLLNAAQRRQILDYQHRVAADDSLPILSTFTYLESSGAFGCGAGLNHIYIDGSGELCPCNLVPLSFGNVAREPMEDLLARMRRHFRQPRAACAGQMLTRHTNGHPLPTPPEVSAKICDDHLPANHAVPQFVQIRLQCQSQAGKAELTDAYDRVGPDYDQFWVSEAGRPVEDLIDRLHLTGMEQILEAGCGTGFATARLARHLAPAGHLLAVDISPGMLTQARRRLTTTSSPVDFHLGDALAVLRSSANLDLVFTAWVLGYIPLKPFFSAGAKALRPGGRLALIVHRENSPRRETEAFAQVVASDPTLLQKRVWFDFPRDVQHLESEVAAAGLEPSQVWDGTVVFGYPSAEAVLEHLLKSGAGTVFHDAIDPARRAYATRLFLDLIGQGNSPAGSFEVRHDFVGCIARRPLAD